MSTASAPATWWRAPVSRLAGTTALLSAALALFLHPPAANVQIVFLTWLGSIGTSSLLAFAIFEWWWSRRAARYFSAGEPLRHTWRMAAMAGLFRSAGLFALHVVGAREGHESWVPLGQFLSGVVPVFLLGVGLLPVLRVYARLGYKVEFRCVDYAAFLAVAAHVLYTARFVFVAMAANTVDAIAVLNWTAEPMRAILLAEALLLRRSILQMKGGLVAHCWTSYVLAILLTTAGNVGLWLVTYDWILGPLPILTWLMWYPAGAAYALAPAFQIEAIERAEAYR